MPTIRTNGVDTYYERRGNGPPIVFVHAAILDSHQWRPQVDVLGEDYTTITYDVRGHGRTGRSELDRYSIELFADDLAALIDELDLETPVLCAHSTGGCIAQVYAARHPEKLSGLVLASTYTPDIATRGEWLQRSLLMRATIPPVRLLGYERVEKAMVWLQERFQGEDVSGDYEAIQALRKEGPTMTSAEFAKVIRAIVAFAESEVDFAAITVPTLVLFGENDVDFVRRHAVTLGGELPDVTVREIPGAGHGSNLDDPEFFTDAVREFVGERPGFDVAESGAAVGDAADS
jgi:pimeloyl-ACP methyl ester carboxylesterase